MAALGPQKLHLSILLLGANGLVGEQVIACRLTPYALTLAKHLGLGGLLLWQCHPSR